MGMKYLADVDTSGGTGDNISVENVKVDSIEIKYGVQESWQTSADDISLHMKLDIGKGFFPDFYIGGQFKVDDVNMETTLSGLTKLELFANTIKLAASFICIQGND